jgi:hypothetical protein
MDIRLRMSRSSPRRSRVSPRSYTLHVMLVCRVSKPPKQKARSNGLCIVAAPAKPSRPLSTPKDRCLRSGERCGNSIEVIEPIGRLIRSGNKTARVSRWPSSESPWSACCHARDAKGGRDNRGPPPRTYFGIRRAPHDALRPDQCYGRGGGAHRRALEQFPHDELKSPQVGFPRSP